jgi:hypothetical protein
MRRWLVWGGLALIAAAAPVEAAGRRFVGTTSANGLTARTTITKVRWVTSGDGATFTAKYRCHGAACPAKGVGQIAGEVQSFRFGGDFGGTVSYRRGLECRLGGSLYAADGVSLWENDQPADEAPRWTFTITCGDDTEYAGDVSVP